MKNKWIIKNIPHKGWVLKDVIDIREAGQTSENTEYKTCMMCNNEKIRFIHIVTHIEDVEEYYVGCVCAEKMTNDYVNPRSKEKKLRSRYSRKINWLKKKWVVTKNGNLTFMFQKHNLLIFLDKKTNKYKCKIGSKWGNKEYEKIEQAKIAVFNGIEYLKEKNDW